MQHECIQHSESSQRARYCMHPTGHATDLRTEVQVKRGQPQTAREWRAGAGNSASSVCSGCMSSAHAIAAVAGASIMVHCPHPAMLLRCPFKNPKASTEKIQ